MSKDIKLQQITQELKQIWGEKLLFQNDKLLHFLLKRLIDTDGLDDSVLQNLNQDLNQANNKLQNCFRTAIFERNSEILKGIPEDKFGKTAINKKKSQDLINETFQNDIQNCKNQPQLQEELYHFLLDNNFAAQRIQRIINQSNKPMQQVQGTGQSAEQWQQQQLQQQQQQQQQYGYYQSNPQIYRQQQQQMPYQQDQQYFNQNLADPSDPSLNQQQYSSYQGNGANPYSFSNHYSNADPLQETSFQRADSNYNDGMFGNNIEDTSGVDASKNNVSYRQDNYIDTYDTFNEPVGAGNEFSVQGNSLLNGTSKQTEYFSNLDQQFLPADQFFGAGDTYRADDFGEMYDFPSGVDGQYPSDSYVQPPSQQPNQQIQQQISQPLQQNQRQIPQQNKNYPNNQTPAASYPPSAVPTNTPQIPPTLPQAAQHENFNQNNSLQSSGVYGPQNNSRQANLPGAPVNDPQNQFYQQQAIQQQQIPQPHNDFSQQQQPGYKQNQVIGSSQNVDQQAYYQQQQQFRNIGPLNNSMHSVNPQQLPLQKPPQIQQNMSAQPQNSNQQRLPVQQQPQQMGGLSSSQQQQNPSLHSSLVGNRVQQPPQQQNPQQIQQQQPQPNTAQLPNQELDTPQPQSDYNQAAVPLNGSVHNPINYQPVPNAQHQPIPNQFNNQQQGMNGLQAYQSLNESNHSQGKGSNSNHGSQHRSSNNKQLQLGQQAVGSPYNPQNMPYQQNPGQPNQSLTSSQYANQQNGRYPPGVYPNQAGPVQGNPNMQQPTFKSTTNLNSSIERINQRAQEDGLKSSYHKANPQYNNPQNFQQGLPAQKGGIPNNPQSSNDLRSSYQQMNQINQTGGQIQPPAVVQQPSNQIKIDNTKGQNIINPQIPNKGIVKPDGNVPPQFNQVGIHQPQQQQQQPPINYQPGQPIPQSVEQQIPHQTIPTTQPGSKANQARLGLQQQQQQQQQQQMLHNGAYNQANQPPGQQPPQPAVQANSKRMNQPMQGPNQIDPQIQQQQFNQGQFNNVQIPPMPQGNAIPVAAPSPSAPVQGPPGALVAGPGGQGYINNGKPSQNSKYLGGQPQGLPQQQQLQGNQQQLQQQQVGLQQQNINQQQQIKQNIQQHQQVQPSQQQQHQQHLQIAGQGYSSNLMHNTQGKPYNVGAKNGGKQSILLEDIPSFLNNPYQIDEDNKGYDLLQITKSENNSPRNSNMNESSSTMNEQHNQFFPTSKNQPLNTSVTQTPTIEYPQNGPNHHAPHQGYPPHLIQKNPNFPVDPNNPQAVQPQQQQPTYMQKGQYPNTYQQQYPYQAMDPNTQHQMMQQGPYNHVPVQSNQVPVNPVNRQMSQNKLNDDQMQPIQMNQQQNPQLQQQWMGQQRGNNMQLQNQNVQMMNPNYFNPQQQQPVQNMMKNGYHQQSSTNNIDNSDMNNSSYFNQQQVDQSKVEDQTQRPNDNMSQNNLDQSPYNLGNSNLQVKKGMNMGPGRQMGMDQIQNQMNVFDNNANPEMMQDGNGEIRNRQNNNSQELKKDQGQAANSAQVVKWTPNQQGLNQDEDLCLIKEVFSKSNSYDPEMQRQITSEVQKFKQNNQNLTIKAIRSQDEPSFKLEIKDKKRKDFKELVLMVCPRKDSPYEITDCKNLWSLNKQRIPKTNSLMDIIKFWWKFEFQTIEDEKKQNSNNNSGGMHNQNQLMPMNGMNNMQQQIQNNLNPY